MTTISVLTLGLSCIAGYAIIELVMWLLEAVFATVKYLVCWFMNKPCNWHQSYLEIRIIFSWLLKYVSFAELTPRQDVKHQRSIRNYLRTLMTKRNQRKQKRSEHNRQMFKQLPGNK